MSSLEEQSRYLDDLWTKVAWRRRDSIITDIPDFFQVITPSSSSIPLNGIYRTSIIKDLSGLIENTIEEYRSYKNPFRWIVTQSTLPTDLGKNLLDKSFKLDFEGYGLSALPSELLSKGPSSIEVRALDLASIDAWIQTSALGWNNPISIVPGLKEDITLALSNSLSPLRYYSAYHLGQMVGTATLRLCEHSAHLFGASVVPAYRGKGVYRALLAERAKVAHSLSCKMLSTHAIATTSAPILLSLGFHKINTCQQFSYTS